MARHLSKTYAPREIEEAWYAYWEKYELFRADVNDPRTPYSIVIPPPNVTGSLHMGHALNNTLQDICVRYKRMDGFNVLWMPGMDHAGIATQNVVEKVLAEEGKTRHDLGREAFIQRVWQWKETYGGVILNQLKRLGASCDWSRERFTMDEGLSRAVREVFVQLYEDDLIYKGDYIINWCPRCATALSDLEVDHEEHAAHLYYIRYPLADAEGSITVATTRPETMLGDTAVAVHPDDERYRHLVGKSCILPLMNRRIPIIADPYVQTEFGTGALKITPAHDPNDFEIGVRHTLEKIRVIDDHGRMNDNAGPFAGMDRNQCRRAVVKALEEQGLLDRVEAYHHTVGHCQRCRTVIEPTLSKQWFVKVKPLAEEAMRSVRDGRTHIVPRKWENDFFAWMENIRDWCISRQIWWGHRIPAWYCRDCEEIIVAREAPERCTACESSSLQQDSDVLDTWFSSALWPFSTMGWPERTPELEVFYPTSLLVTGFDILTFWVARMMMMGLKFMDDVPFRDVYIHALVRDIEGRKMSKSLGNVLDPLEVIDEYGADAFRFALAAFAAQGRDIKLSTERIEGYRNFMNKFWNAARFVLMNIDEKLPEPGSSAGADLSVVDRWIRSRLTRTIQEVRCALDQYRFNDAAAAVYQFLWHEYCDWYLEWIKPDLYAPERQTDRQRVQTIMIEVLTTVVQLLHPFAPFITEEIWTAVYPARGSVMQSQFPETNAALLDDRAEEEIRLVQGIIGGIRNLRAEMDIAPGTRVPVVLIPPPDLESVFRKHGQAIEVLARVGDLTVDSGAARPPMAVYALSEHTEIHLPLEGLVDFGKEKMRLNKEIQDLDQELAATLQKLSNEAFIRKAPAEIVDKARMKQEELEHKKRKLEAGLQRIQGFGGP
jgi:valyl-tRNA synthetase